MAIIKWIRKEGISNHQTYEWYLYNNLNQFFCVNGLVNFSAGMNLQEKKIRKTPIMLIMAVTRMIFSANGDNKKTMISLYWLIH